MSRDLVTDELWAMNESLLTLQMTVRTFRDTTARPYGNRSLLVASTQPFVYAPPARFVTGAYQRAHGADLQLDQKPALCANQL